MHTESLAPRAAPSFAATEAVLAKQVSMLRTQFLVLAEKLASTEDRIALYYEEAAGRHPSRADKYWLAAQDARVNAQRARKIARQFHVPE